MKLDGLAAIVTGGASGMGGATAECLAAGGAKVTIFDLNEGAGRAHAAAIGGSFAKANVVDEASVPAGLDAAEPVGEKRSVIVHTASVAAHDGQIGQAACAASKGGVVTIAPGIFLPPMLKNLPEAAQESLGHQVPHPSRLSRPEEFAQLAESFVANPMLNGEVTRPDGAIRMAPC